MIFLSLYFTIVSSKYKTNSVTSASKYINFNKLKIKHSFDKSDNPNPFVVFSFQTNSSNLVFVLKLAGNVIPLLQEPC